MDNKKNNAMQHRLASFTVRIGLLIQALVLCTLASAAFADSITLTGTLRDFKSSHPDFQMLNDVGNWSFAGLDEGIVKQQLGSDRKPVFNGPTKSTHNATAFDQWYRNVQNINTALPYSIVLEKNGDVYRYQNNSFFPLDNQLFGNEGNSHNYHMTYEIHSSFTYQGGEVFEFSGDDDVWVFINNQLVVDIGGVHTSISRSVALDDLTLTVGETYSFDFFWAERHTSQSNFTITTSIELESADKQVSGAVFEDKSGDALYDGDNSIDDQSGDQVALSDVRIRLYHDENGDGLANGGAFLGEVTTDANGQYQFPNLANGYYHIVVDSKSIGSNPQLHAEQTYAAKGGLCSNGTGATQSLSQAGACYGGRTGGGVDNISAWNTREHIISLTINDADVSGLDFGFSFNAVTTLNNSGQGSLRQFILNANHRQGANSMRFVPMVAMNEGNSWRLDLSSPLPLIEGAHAAQTTIDGTAYAANGSVRNENTGTVGHGGETVGTGDDVLENSGDEFTLPMFNKPELAINANDQLAYTEGKAQYGVIIIKADAVTIEHIALYNAAVNNDESQNSYTAGAGILVKTGNNTLIQNNLLGVKADGSDPELGERLAHAIFQESNDATVIKGNYIAHIASTGVWASDNAHLQLNDFYQAAYNSGGNAINTSESSGGLILIEKNRIEGSAAYGIENWQSPSTLEIKHNTLIANGQDSRPENLSEYGGIRIYGNNNLIEHNVIKDHADAGIVVIGDQNGNTISQNILYNNGGLSIDLDLRVINDLPNTDSGNGDGVSANDGQTLAQKPNRALDYPVFTKAVMSSSGLLHVEGYVGTDNSPIAGNHILELYKADNDGDNKSQGEVIFGDGLNQPHGEGRWFLGSITTDADGRFSADLTPPAAIPLALGDYITATATDSNANTSEFSGNTLIVEDRPEFDLALQKRLADGQSDTVQPGETVTYILEVTNQGRLDATEVYVVDYLPAGLTLNDDDWVLNTNMAEMIEPIDRIRAGETVGIPITFTANSSLNKPTTQSKSSETGDEFDLANFVFVITTEDECLNAAEISSAKGGDDVDSTYDTIPGDSGEDDYSEALINIPGVCGSRYDYGDAPDKGVGTDTADYRTLRDDNGPRHEIGDRLYLGACVDNDLGSHQNSDADGDDSHMQATETYGSCAQAGDDEDGVIAPLLTVGQLAPRIDIAVFNQTGQSTNVACWVDYNGDGVFDNDTERSSQSVPNSPNGQIQTLNLTLPDVPTRAFVDTGGTTYMRCRVASTSGADNAYGVALDGEVEDYKITIEPSCEVSVAISNKQCNNGNTGTPNDDTWQFDARVTGLNVSANWLSSGALSAQGEYDSTQTFSAGAIAANDNINLVFSDQLDNSCYVVKDIEAPASCSTPIVTVDNISIMEGNLDENGLPKQSRLDFIVNLDSPAGAQGVSIEYSTADGVNALAASTADNDYQASNGTLTIPAGETSGVISVMINGDLRVEEDETFVLNLDSASNATLQNNQITATLVNDDLARDYGDAPQTYGTDQAEGLELGYIFSPNHIVTPDLRMGNLLDADEPSTWSYSNAADDDNSFEADEDGISFGNIVPEEPFVITASIVNTTEQAAYFACWVDYNGDGIFATNLSEYAATTLEGSDNALTLTMPPVPASVYANTGGTTYLRCRVSTESFEDPENATTYPGGSRLDGEVEDYQVTVDEPTFIPPEISIADAEITEGDSGEKAMSFSVSLDRPAAGNGVQIEYTTVNDTASVGNADYQNSAGTLTIPAGDSSATIEVMINGDTQVEADERFLLNLFFPLNANLADDQAIGTIINDDATSTCNANSGDFGGTVFHDNNGNGVRDDGELGMEGVLVKAYNSANTVVATAQSNSAGLFVLVGLSNGTDYRLEFSTIPTEYKANIYNNSQNSLVRFIRYEGGFCEQHLALVKSGGESCEASQTTTTTYTELSFTSPMLEFGQALQQGAIYRFANVAQGTDALVEIQSLNHNATLNKIDDYSNGGYSSAFQPVMNTGSHNGSSIDFLITLVEAGTETPKPINTAASALDIDGNSSTLREFVELSLPASYSLENPTKLTVTPQGNDLYVIPNTTQTGPGVDKTLTTHIITANYENQASFHYRIGATNNGSSQRLYSLYFKEISYSNENNTGVANCDSEIGDYVWLDENTNGLQDANESGLPSVDVRLECGNDLATTATDNKGFYVFSNAENANATFMGAEEACTISLDMQQSALNSAQLSSANQGDDAHNSDAVLVGTKAEIALTTPVAGVNQHHLDIGFSGVTPNDPDPEPTAALLSDFRFAECQWGRYDGQVTDYATLENHGLTRNGTKESSTSILDQSARFDGDNDTIMIPHHDTYEMAEGTIAFWFRAHSLSNNTNRQGLFSKDYNGNNHGGNLSIYLDDKHLKVRQQNQQSNNYRVLSSGDLKKKKWYHLAYTFGAQGMQLYINGNLVDSDNDSSGLTGNVEPIILGALSWSDNSGQEGAHNHFRNKGRLDEVKLFNYALSATEVDSMYDNEDDGKNYDGSIRQPLACFSIRPLSSSTVEPIDNDTLEWESVLANPGLADEPTVSVSSEIPEGTKFEPLIIAARSIGQKIENNDGVVCETRGDSVTEVCTYEEPSSLYPRGRVLWQGKIVSEEIDTQEVANRSLSAAARLAKIEEVSRNEVLIRYRTEIVAGTDLESIENDVQADWDTNGDGTADITSDATDPNTHEPALFVLAAPVDNGNTDNTDGNNGTDGNTDNTDGNGGTDTNNTDTPNNTNNNNANSQNPVQIPSLSVWGLLILSGLLGLLGTFKKTRRIHN